MARHREPPPSGGPDVEQLSAELEAMLVRELMLQWLLLNAHVFRKAMRSPTILLIDAEGVLGRWNGQRRTIEISRALVQRAGWGQIVELLKHEMAHQYVHEVLGVVDETAHGPAFRGVCERFGIDAAAAGMPGAGEAPDPERDRMRAKIENLLALARSSNRNEAETAAALAQKLMLKYNVALGQRSDRRRYGFRHLGAPKSRIPESEHILAGILAKHFFVEAVWITVYEPHLGKHNTVLEICGTPENLEIASYVHAFLTETAERLWREHKRAAGIPGNRERRSYLSGVMEGFRERLRMENRKHAAEGLVWVGDADLQGYFRTRHPRVRTTRLRGNAYSEARSHGRAAGRNIVLSRGVSEGPSGTTRALPPKRG